MAEPFRVLSWGAGIDSTTLLLMSQHGELPRLDAAIFSDTQSEPQGVYETVEWVSAAIDIPLYRVTVGNLGQDILKVARETRDEQERALEAYDVAITNLTTGGRHPTITLQVPKRTAGHVGQPPFYVKNAPNKAYATADSGGVLWRKCTADYKITPIRQKVRQLVGLKPIGRVPASVHVEQWIGFSLDDMGRTFCSDVAWITNVFPLILPKHMRRRDCIAWLKDHGYPIPMKSSCTFCPYHSNAYWREMRDTRPGEWQETVAFESQLHAGTLPGVRGIPYLHKSMVPLPMAPIDAPDTGQEELFCMHCNT